MHSFTHAFIHHSLFIHPFINSPMHLFTHASILPSSLSIYPCILHHSLSIHPCIHSPIHPSIIHSSISVALTKYIHVHRLDIAFLREYCLLLQGRRDLKTIVYCYGGGACNIELNTATTAGDVSPSILPSIYPFIHSPILLIKSSIHHSPCNLSIIH